jgi:hypothetical protein
MTTTTAHILYFVPDLVAGQRFALGALLVTPTGTTFVSADLRPGADCLRGPTAVRFAQRLLERAVCLREPISRHVAEVMGQYARLGDPIEIPEGVASAEHWLRTHMLPKQEPADGGRGAGVDA